MNSTGDEKRIFEKKEIIYSETMGLCVVADVTRLAAEKSTPVPYYVLRSYYDKNRVAYIPVEDHKVELRDVISEAEAVSEFDKLREAFAENDQYEPDELKLGEIAYVYRMSIDELLDKVKGTLE